jgi:hypothetical protein
MAMRASCRNSRAVVTGCAADYHSRMPAVAANEYRLVERSGPGARVQFRRQVAGETRILVISGWHGAAPPATVTDPRLESSAAGAWRLSGSGGVAEFGARAADSIVMRPGLYEDLHRPFRLKRGERIAARCLLALLRLPGGARLLRNWHSKRNA